MTQEKHVVEAFRRGEHWAFSKLYNRYARQLLAFINGHVNDAAAAEDLRQEVFFKAFRFRGRYLPHHAFSTWLWTIARNTLTDWYRKCRGEAVMLENNHDGNTEHFVSTEPSPEAALVKEKEQHDKLSNLTERQRQVLWLRVINHLSYHEIAKKLGMSLSAVKCLIYRTKKQRSSATIS
jgi:RNA polymerase sigma-70 factor (ECF subfamily)